MAKEGKLQIPGDGQWTFENKDVADKFDAHVRESLPWYDLATGIVQVIARHFIPEGGRVYDVGASTGNIGKAINSTLQSRKAGLIAIEPSEAMQAMYKGPGLIDYTSAQKAKYEDADLIICFLVMMFIPPHERGPLIQRMKDALRPGGAIVIFDKLVPTDGEVGILSLRMVLGAKYEHGATPEEIIAKELALAGVQRALYPRELEGFECIFRFGTFGGWVWTKT